MSLIQQSHLWQTFQESLGRSTHVARGDGWSYLAIKETGRLNQRLYLPYGPVCSSPEGFDTALASLKSLAKQQQVTFVRIEPTKGITPEQLKQRGFWPVSYQSLQPAHTQIINLTPPEETILANMSQNSRNITRNYHKKGLTIHASHNPSDISTLTALLSKVAARNQIGIHSPNYFQKQAEALMPSQNATLYTVNFQDKPIAAALVYDFDGTRTYAHAAADDEYRKLNAGTALLGQMIIDAKQAGMARFDLFGIANSDDPKHPWAGFTRFKQSFGGEPLTHPGTWDLPINKLGYLAYRTYHSLRHKLR